MLFIMVLLFAAASCRPGNREMSPSPKDSASVAVKVEDSAIPDSTAITNTLHGFFAWYDAHLEELGWMRFVDEAGPHLKLNEPKLKEYFADLKASGFISDDLLEEERKFYKACEKAWAHEEKDEVPTGLEADRFHCAQDYVAPYPSGQVRSVIQGDTAQAELILTGEMGEKASFHFTLKKENGKWLLARLGCPTGFP